MNSKLPIIPMPAGAIMRLVCDMVKSNPNMKHPVTMEDLLRAKDRYIMLASKLN